MVGAAEVGCRDRDPVGCREPEDRDGARATAAGAGRGEHHDRQTREEIRERMAAGRDAEDDAVEVMQHAREQPGAWSARREATDCSPGAVGIGVAGTGQYH